MTDKTYYADRIELRDQDGKAQGIMTRVELQAHAAESDFQIARYTALKARTQADIAAMDLAGK